ncbi:hypothetical protein B0T20DRAFT_390785 [Sordaria brevicollis]|uniref:Uncharacterized protein n=1 Tax=Sordaria brevicollis TaxID=83679 RepID=A0AAE0UEA7_SORBR|nr:hypothetical protein B0T20DRAFT_390785 [Sordaria brevicollis]
MAVSPQQNFGYLGYLGKRAQDSAVSFLNHAAPPPLQVCLGVDPIDSKPLTKPSFLALGLAVLFFIVHVSFGPIYAAHTLILSMAVLLAQASQPQSVGWQLPDPTISMTKRGCLNGKGYGRCKSRECILGRAMTYTMIFNTVPMLLQDKGYVV